MPSLLKRTFVSLLSALALIATVAGSQWLLRHPMPPGGWGAVAMVAGLGAMVYGARKRN